MYICIDECIAYIFAIKLFVHTNVSMYLYMSMYRKRVRTRCCAAFQSSAGVDIDNSVKMHDYVYG